MMVMSRKKDEHKVGILTGKQDLSGNFSGNLTKIVWNECNTGSAKKALEASLVSSSMMLAGKLIVNTTDATNPMFNKSSKVLATLSLARSSYASISSLTAIPSPFLSIDANKNLIARLS